MLPFILIAVYFPIIAQFAEKCKYKKREREAPDFFDHTNFPMTS